jgi:2-keto-3-deoxy-L-fuconate dehydrogenase
LQRVLITQSTDWLGPSLCAAFQANGDAVIADHGDLTTEDAEQRMSGYKDIDVLIAHLAVPAPHSKATDVTDTEWRNVFLRLVDPLPRLIRAILPGMLNRGAGRIIVIGSAAPLRGMKRASTYSAARGAQIAYVRAVGAEVAAQNVQVNLIAPNFIDHPMYFPQEVQASDAFQRRLKNDVPAGRMGKPEELVAFAVFLASGSAGFFSGQTFPISGGWAT